MAVEDTDVTTGDDHLTQEFLSILSYLTQERPLWTCKHSQVEHREIMSSASCHFPFPAHASLISLQESWDTAPSMQRNTLRRSLVMLLVSSLP